jgi:hypothetical protein
MTKQCKRCGSVKPANEFGKNKKAKDGLQSSCKKCWREYNKKYYKANRADCYQRVQAWRKKNPEKVKQYQDTWNTSRQSKEYKQKALRQAYARHKERYKNDAMYRLKCLSRQRLHHALRSKGWRKNTKTQEYIGCDWQTLKAHIEARFIEGMSWQNYGEWHIDHVVPLSSARSEDELKKLANYTNLQPLWAIDNMIKSDALP